MPTTSFSAGSAQIDITPPLGSRIGVDFFSHYARFIHDPLFAKTVIMRQGDSIMAFIMVDICIMPSDLMQFIKDKIERDLHIPKENVLLACTHTHGAPDVAGLLGGAVDIAYRNRFPDMVLRSVSEALKKVRPAKMASGSVSTDDFHVCRRYILKEDAPVKNPITDEQEKLKTNPFGLENAIVERAAPVDTQIGFLALKGLDDSWISIMANFSSHYAGDWEVDTITADFYGTFAERLSKKLDRPEDFVGILSYGTGADVNTWDFLKPDKFLKEDFFKSDLIGKTLADQVLDASERCTWDHNPILKIKYTEIPIEVRKASAEELDLAKKTMEGHSFEKLSIDEHGMKMIYAREQWLLAEYPETHSSCVQAIRIGNQVIGALGGEFFSETGLWLKQHAKPFDYFTVCLANSYDGYVPPEHEMKKGGYETWRARSSFLSVGAEKKIREKLLEMIKKL